MPKSEALERQPSTGNVFADLGLPDAGEHLIKAGLVVRIGRTIRQRKLTQAAAAQVVGVVETAVAGKLYVTLRPDYSPQVGLWPRIVYRSAMIASRGTPLCPATARRMEFNVPSLSGWWSGTAIRW